MRSLWLLVALGAVLSACDSSGGDPLTPAPSTPGTVAGLVPLSVGNTWVFEGVRTRYDETNGSVTRVDTLAAPDTLRVTGTETIGGETWYRLQSRNGVLNTIQGGLYANRADGVYRRASADDPALRLYAYPVEAGFVYGLTNPFTLDGGGVSFQQLLTVKRTDYPVDVAGLDTEGVLYTSLVELLRASNTDYPTANWTPPLRSVLAPGAGFVVLESAYFSIVTGPATMAARYRYTLTEVMLVVVD